MMRNKASSSMQKTYDECYLICSTAVYFEGQVCSSSSSYPSIHLTADHYPFNRTTKPRHYDHGVLHSIKSTITMLTGFRQITSQSQRPRGPCRNHFGIWSSNARNASIFWKHCEGVGRTPKTAETGTPAARQREIGHPCLQSLISLRNIKQMRGGLERALCLQ